MKIFEQYVRKYDMNNVNIKSKYFHSLKVMEMCKELASGLDILNEEDVAVCELLGLFHEIGSFSKTPDFHIDDEVEDYYDKTIDILFNKKLIREISPDNKYDNTIKLALFAYNKEGFPSDITAKEKYIIAILKDAHKLDSFRVFESSPYVDTRIKSYPSNLVYEDFKKYKTISPKMSDNSADSVLVVLSNMYSFSYRYSYYVLKQNKYIEKIIDNLTFDSQDFEKFFRAIMVVLGNYVDGKIGVKNA